jgi:AbrB family looped-hinge helix DNA binding protein
VAETVERRRTVRALAKGQITIPNEFREALGIDRETLLDVALVGDHLEIKPLRPEAEAFRRYSEEDIARFLEEDRVDEDTAQRVRDLLRRGEL